MVRGGKDVSQTWESHEPIGEDLTGATARCRESRDVRVGQMMRVGMFKLVLCKEVVSVLLKYFMGMAIMSGWGTLPLPSVVKTKPVDEILREATVRTVMRGGTKVKFCGRTWCVETGSL